ncbi:hypothetical protein [Natrialba swarupiae]|uniref:Uncharacterized protein n=1 Tax=Natrialba swarupiae TaxID=2448032 RepID=A0A5D5AHS5_9EURY|nr:hypothetical protein [Natrialba swarupiae]MCW8173055.1 hypothetical protein [Natrialba swarupiae]TYT60565.1 hypothetical protein FYC77_18005 [Natrialba swarupiae]
MSGLDEASDAVYRTILFGIVLYFVLFGYGTIAGVGLAILASQFVFGVVAVAVGTLLYTQADNVEPAILGASICLVVGGTLQFAFLLAPFPVLDRASSIAVFVGIGLYILAVWLE